MKQKSDSIDLVVLENCKFWLNNFGLCSESEDRTFGAKHQMRIPIWLIRVLYAIPTCTSILLATWHLVDNNWNLSATSVAIIIIVGAGQCQLIYFLLIAKNTSFVSVVDQLQTLVDKRE